MRPRLAMILACVVSLVVVAAAGSAESPTSANLTGRWSSNDGGTYFVRQVGKEVWWSGRKLARNEEKAYTNVFHGTIEGNVITGSLADVPEGKNRNAGQLTLEVSGEGQDLKITRTKGRFGATTWTPHVQDR